MQTAMECSRHIGCVHTQHWNLVFLSGLVKQSTHLFLLGDEVPSAAAMAWPLTGGGTGISHTSEMTVTSDLESCMIFSLVSANGLIRSMLNSRRNCHLVGGF